MAALVLCASLRADDVWAGKPGRKPLRYADVRIVGYRAGELIYVTRAGNDVAKPIEEIVRIRLEDNAALNEAEKVFAEGKPAETVKRYETVLAEAIKPWLKDYVTAKLATAYDQAGQADKAVEAWLATLDTWPGYAALHLPSHFGPKGSPANARALERLDAALQKSMPEELKDPVRKIQASLLEVEGKAQAAASVRERISTPKPRETSKGPQEEGAVPTRLQGEKTDVVSALAVAERTAEQGQYDDAIARVNSAIRTTPERRRKAYLPRLLALKARCYLAKGDRQAKAEKPDAARKNYHYAGLAAMHVIAFYPETLAYIECLHLVGKVQEKLGAKKKAIALYQECLEFAIGREQPTWERKARVALERLDVKGK